MFSGDENTVGSEKYLLLAGCLCFQMCEMSKTLTYANVRSR